MSAPDSLNPKTKIVSGLKEISDQYDGYIFDIWGVLHNGVEIFAGVHEALTHLQKLGKKVVLLTNSPRRSSLVTEQLASEYGIMPDHYNDIISSGEATYLDLHNQIERHGNKCYFMGQDMHRGILSDVDALEPVMEIEEADFILNTGPEDLHLTFDQLRIVLQKGIERHLLMICSNPDHRVIIGKKEILCAGALAYEYEKMGGEVHYHGKPHTFVYELAHEKLDHIPKERILALGDSLHNDILGGKNYGIDTLLVLSGLHGQELQMLFGDMPLPKDIDTLALTHKIRPVYAAPSLRW